VTPRLKVSIFNLFLDFLFLDFLFLDIPVSGYSRSWVVTIASLAVAAWLP
jgi:hypothetical protein